MSNPQAENKPQIKIKTSEEILRGAYATQILVSSSNEEFVLDFISLLPNSQAASLLSRIVLSPAHAKRLAKTLATQVEQYEGSHGAVKTQEEVKPSFGFQTE